MPDDSGDKLTGPKRFEDSAMHEAAMQQPPIAIGDIIKPEDLERLYARIDKLEGSRVLEHVKKHLNLNNLTLNELERLMKEGKALEDQRTSNAMADALNFRFKH